MRILVLQSDDRDQNQEGYHSYCSKINQLYCKKHGYDYHYEKVVPTNRHPSWLKLPFCISMIEMYEDRYDYYVYVDSDCIFKDFGRSIEYYIENVDYMSKKTDAQISFLNDQPWDNTLPCAGFFIFTSKNKEMFQNWWSIQLPDYDLVHPFEQKALYTKLGQYNFNLIDDWMFVEVQGQFLRHIGSNEGHLRLPYFKEFYNNLIQKNEGN